VIWNGIFICKGDAGGIYTKENDSGLVRWGGNFPTLGSFYNDTTCCWPLQTKQKRQWGKDRCN